MWTDGPLNHLSANRLSLPDPGNKSNRPPVSEKIETGPGGKGWGRWEGGETGEKGGRQRVEQVT